MAGSELPRRRSPRHSGGAPPADAHAENVLPSPAAATPSKPATTPIASEAKENVASATPSSILKRRRRSILSEVSKVDGKSPGGAGRLSEAARKKRKQSLASRRVSFAVESALESVREFQKDERDAEAFPDPSQGAAADDGAKTGGARLAQSSTLATVARDASVPPKPPAPATTATCPPPGPAPGGAPPPASPFGAGPASAAAEAAMAAMAAFSPAATPVSGGETGVELRGDGDALATPVEVDAKAKVDPFAAFGVSDSPAAPSPFGSAAAAEGAADVSTPDGARGLNAHTSSAPRVSSDAMARVSNASDFIPLGTPVSALASASRGAAPSSAAPSSAAPSSAARSPSRGAASASPAVVPSPGSMFTAHLPRRVTMDPAQYRDAMRAAAEDARDPTEEAIIEEEEEEEEEEDSAAPTGRADEETETETSAGVGFSGDDDAVAGAITAAVPGLSALADEDEDDFGVDAPGEAGSGDVAVARGDITAAVPGLSALADADDDEVAVAAASAEKSPSMQGLPMGSVTEDVAANLAAELAAAVAADNQTAPAPAGSAPAPQPETTEEFAFSAALRESESSEPGAGRKSLAKKRRMTLGVRHDVPDVPADALPSPAADSVPETATEEDAAAELNLSDSFEVPPGAEAAAASVASEGLTTRERLFAAGEATEPTPAPSSDAFSEPGTHTLDALAKMKNDARDAEASASDAAATAGGDTNTATGSVLPIPDGMLGSLAGSLTGGFASALKRTPASSAAQPGASPYSSEGTVTPANPTPASDAGSEGDGFTPGPDTLLMMEKLKGRKHGDAVLDSVRRTIGRPSLSAHAWVAPTPLPPIGGAIGTAFTPTGAGTIAGGRVSGAAYGNQPRFGVSSAPKPVFGAFGEHTQPTGFSSGPSLASPFAPGASQRAALRSAKKQNDALALGALGLPLESLAALLGPDATASARPVELREFFHACEVSFMDAKNLRRKSLATTSVCGAPPPASVAEALELVCLTAPAIEALDPMHDFLNESLATLAGDIESLRGEVEAAQPPLLRLAASRDPAHAAALRDAGKMLKKQCQLAAKEEHAARRLAAERAVAASLRVAKASLEKMQRSLRDSREVAAECAQSADTREVDLKRRIALTGDAASRDARRMRTREGALLALAERRARVARLRAALGEANAGVVAAQSRRGEAEAETARLEAALAEARAGAEARGDADGVLADGGAARRAASAARLGRLAERAKRAGDALRVANRVAPWTLEKVGVSSSPGGGAELVARVGRLFRVAVDLGTGAGRITLCGDLAGGAVTPAGGAAFAAAVAGAPRAWSETSPEACGGDAAAVLQRVAPALRRAEGVLAEAEQCRAAFPRITRVRCTAGGDMELTFADLQTERKVRVALTMARGAYPRGALRPRVAVEHAGATAGPYESRGAGAGVGSRALPDAAVIEAAIERVPAGEASRRLLGVCRLVDWIVARGEQGVVDAAREAAAAARAPPPAPAPDVFLGAEGATLPAVARRGEGGDAEAEAPEAPKAEAAEAAESSAAGPRAFSSAERAGFPEEAPKAAEEALARAETTSGSGRAEAEATAPVEPSVSSPSSDSPGSDWGERAGAEAAGEAPASDGRVAKTPAGFQKGSNPLFDDSDEETDAGEGHA